MSTLTSIAARSWSGVSSYGNEASISPCQGVSIANAKPAAASRFAYRLSSSSARSLTALRTRCLVRSQSVPPSRESWGFSPPLYRLTRLICSTGTKIRSAAANESSR